MWLVGGSEPTGRGQSCGRLDQPARSRGDSIGVGVGCRGPQLSGSWVPLSPVVGRDPEASAGPADPRRQTSRDPVVSAEVLSPTATGTSAIQHCAHAGACIDGYPQVRCQAPPPPRDGLRVPCAWARQRPSPPGWATRVWPAFGPERPVLGASRQTAGSGPAGNAKYGPYLGGIDASSRSPIRVF